MLPAVVGAVAKVADKAEKKADAPGSRNDAGDRPGKGEVRETDDKSPRDLAAERLEHDAKDYRAALDKGGEERDTPESRALREPATSRDDGERADLEELSREYSDELRERSDFAPRSVDVQDWEPRSPEQVAEARKEYGRLRPRLISEWEEKHGEPWSRYTHDVEGPPAQKAGQAYPCHHIQPLEAGGSNTVDNIVPLHIKDHTGAKEGVHRSGSPLRSIVSALKSNQR